MDFNILKQVEKIIAYEFDELGLLQQAFTRKSYVEENGGLDNDVLEFYGDEALDYSITRLLQNKFGRIDSNCFISKYNSGELTQLKSYLVDSEMLAHRIDELDLAKYLIVGNGDSKNDINQNKSVKEQLFEAIIGAVAIDSDHDLSSIDCTVNKMLNPNKYINEYSIDGLNYIDLIQKWNQVMYKKLPTYSEAIKEENNWNISLFLTINQVIHKFSGKGSTISLARRTAAKEGYLFLKQNGLLTKKIEIDVLDGVNSSNAYAKLKELETNKQIKCANLVELEQDKNSLGNAIWPVKVDVIDNCQNKYSSIASTTSKQKSKNEAALEILKKIGKVSMIIGLTATSFALLNNSNNIKK